MFSQAQTATVLLLLCSTALGQLTLSNVSFTGTPSPSISATTSTIAHSANFTTTSINANATATSISPIDACVIFVSASGTVPAFTITSQLPIPTTVSVNGTLNNTFTTSQSFNTSSVTAQFNSTTFPGPSPTNVSSFATTFYATVYSSSGGSHSTSYGLPVPSGLPICPNVTLSTNGTNVNGTNSTTTGQSSNSTKDGNSNSPSSAISIQNVGRSLGGALVGAIGGLALAVI